MPRYTKSVDHPKGRIDLSAIRHGAGWRVTATQMATGFAHTAYDIRIAYAEHRAIDYIRREAE